MWNWLHHFLEPHCPQCREEAIEKQQAFERCPNCETMERLFENERTEKTRLLHLLTAKPIEPEIDVKDLPKPINRVRPWRVIQAELEANSRAEAERRRAMAENSPEVASVSSIEELEQKAGVSENG